MLDGFNHAGITNTLKRMKGSEEIKVSELLALLVEK